MFPRILLMKLGECSYRVEGVVWKEREGLGYENCLGSF